MDHPQRGRRERRRSSGDREAGIHRGTNLVARGEFIALTPVKQKSGKLVHALAFDADFDLAAFASNTFEMEWPPQSGRRRSFPEIDRIEYFSVPTAMTKIIVYQRPLVVELQTLIGDR